MKFEKADRQVSKMPSLAGVLVCFTLLVASGSCLGQPAIANEAAGSPTSSSAAAAGSSSSSGPWFFNLHNKQFDERASSRPTVWSPNSFASFLFSNARAASGDPFSSNRLALLGHKRSTSGLDPLAGGTMGKRSPRPAEMVNYEPIYGRRFGPPNAMPRVFEMRTTPFELSGDSDYSSSEL